MANWGAFSEAFSNSFTRAQDQKKSKEEKLQEQAFREAALKLQAQLENQAMTPEQKNAQAFGFQMNPQGLKDYNMSRDPYQGAKLNLDSRELSIKAPYWQAQTNALNNPQTNEMQNLNYFMRQGLSMEEAMKRLEQLRKTSSFNPYSFMGGMGGGNPAGGGGSNFGGQ